MLHYRFIVSRVNWNFPCFLGQIYGWKLCITNVQNKVASFLCCISRILGIDLYSSNNLNAVPYFTSPSLLFCYFRSISSFKNLWTFCGQIVFFPPQQIDWPEHHKRSLSHTILLSTCITLHTFCNNLLSTRIQPEPRIFTRPTVLIECSNRN